MVVNRSASGASSSQSTTKPTRAVNRDGDIAFGLRGGTYGTEYLGGGGYSDMGVGLTARFRPVESIGLEVAYEHHSQNFEDNTERINNPLQTSVQVYAFPWTRVSPYATLGLTWNNRTITDNYYNGETFRQEVAQADDTLFGPHAGLGLELALGDSAALNFEGRYINYLNVTQDDVSAPGAVQGTAGLNFYF
ncbi:MAG: outer membrane beta-barrel protein [Myxococcota bacterium]|nr:outer membrane beta-barrel protein [Myxococcota bacterium]